MTLASVSLTNLFIYFLSYVSQMQIQQLFKGKYRSSTTLTLSSSFRGYLASSNALELLSVMIGSILTSLMWLVTCGSTNLLLFITFCIWFLRVAAPGFRPAGLGLVSAETFILSSSLRRLQYLTAWMVFYGGRWVVLIYSESPGRWILPLPSILREPTPYIFQEYKYELIRLRAKAFQKKGLNKAQRQGGVIRRVIFGNKQLKSAFSVSQDDPAFEKAIDELLSKLEEVLLEAVPLDEFPGLEVFVDVLAIDLLDGEAAQVPLGLAEDDVSKFHVDVPKAEAAKFGLVRLVLVALIEDGVQNLLCLNLALHVLGPQSVRHLLVHLVHVLVVGKQDHLFQSIIQMLLIVVERRIRNLSNFLGFLHSLCRLTFWKNKLTFAVLGRWGVFARQFDFAGQFFLNQAQKLRNIIHRIPLVQALQFLPRGRRQHLD